LSSLATVGVRDFWENGCSRAERRTNRRRLWCGVPSFEGELPDRGQWTQAMAGGRVIPPSGSHRATAAATPAPSAQEGGGAGAAAAAAAVVGATGQRAAQGGGCRRPRVSSVDSRSATTGADERSREAQRNSRRACHPSQSSKASATTIKEDPVKVRNGRSKPEHVSLQTRTPRCRLRRMRLRRQSRGEAPPPPVTLPWGAPFPPHTPSPTARAADAGA